MAFVPFEDTVKLEAVYTWDGQIVENVFHYIVDATPDVELLNEMAPEWIGLWDANIRPLQPAGVVLVAVKLTIMETEFSPGIEFTTGLPLAGQNASPSLPNNVSVAIRWLTALRGRSYRGRTYHIGLSEADVERNQLVTGKAAELQFAYSEIIAVPTLVGPAIMGVASRVSDGVLRTQGVITPVLSCGVDPTVDSQRRRLPGRGR